MTATQRKIDDLFNTLNIKEHPQKLYDSMMFLKVNNLEEQVQNIEDRLSQSEQRLGFLLNEKDMNVPIDSLKRRIIEREKSVSQSTDSWQECEKIVERALEILSDWENADDIKIQTQYASVIIGKIDNLKKVDIISYDKIRTEVCTLLRNVIRLNFEKDIFSQGQIALLKEGFSLVIKRDIQKETLFWLNNKLRKEGLLTMPAWE